MLELAGRQNNTMQCVNIYNIYSQEQQIPLMTILLLLFTTTAQLSLTTLLAFLHLRNLQVGLGK